MDERTRRALLEINRRFYEATAETFDATRQRPWPGWRRILPILRDSEAMRILDAGCGNARFGLFLNREITARLDYLGVDSSAGLLAAAAPAVEKELGKAELVEADLESWLGESTAAGFQLITLFGVMHHIPGEDERRRLLVSLSRRLAPGGHLIVTWWMLHESSRWRKKIVPWSELRPEPQRPDAEPLDLSKLEPGDTLLGWQGQSSKPRYCHFPGLEELEALKDLPSLELQEEFREDGPTGEDNLYRVYRRISIPDKGSAILPPT